VYYLRTSIRNQSSVAYRFIVKWIFVDFADEYRLVSQHKHKIKFTIMENIILAPWAKMCESIPGVVPLSSALWTTKDGRKEPGTKGKKAKADPKMGKSTTSTKTGAAAKSPSLPDYQAQRAGSCRSPQRRWRACWCKAHGRARALGRLAILQLTCREDR
jgi:hypothetical protein